MIFSLCFNIILSISLSFLLLHAINFKKHLHSFFTLLTIATDNNNNNNNNNLHHQKPVIPLPPPPMTAIHHDIGYEMQVDENEYCWRRQEAEGGVNSNTFPPPLSSLDVNGQPSFVLLPVRKDGRLQLYKVKPKRPEILIADRQDGRLRLYLVRDQYIEDDVEYLQEECEFVEEEKITVLESESESEEEMVEENRYEYEEDDRVRECNNNNERYRRSCNHHQLVNHIHGSHNNLLMYGVSIA